MKNYRKPKTDSQLRTIRKDEQRRNMRANRLFVLMQKGIR